MMPRDDLAGREEDVPFETEQKNIYHNLIHLQLLLRIIDLRWSKDLQYSYCELILKHPRLIEGTPRYDHPVRSLS